LRGDAVLLCAPEGKAWFREKSAIAAAALLCEASLRGIVVDLDGGLEVGAGQADGALRRLVEEIEAEPSPQNSGYWLGTPRPWAFGAVLEELERAGIATLLGETAEVDLGAHRLAADGVRSAIAGEESAEGAVLALLLDGAGKLRYYVRGAPRLRSSTGVNRPFR